MTNDGLLLRIGDVARLLALSKSKTYAMARFGELPGVVTLGGSVRVHRPTLEAWLATLAAPADEKAVRALDQPRTASEDRRVRGDHRPAA